MSQSNGVLPKGWAEATISDTGDYINGLAFKPSDWEAQGLPIIRIQNLTDPLKPFNRTSKNVPADFLVEQGDILVSWSATLDVFRWRSERAVLNQHIFKVRPRTQLVTPQFLFFLLRHTISEIRSSSGVHGSTMSHINRGPFLSFPVLLPSLPEQQRIVDEIEQQFTRLDAAMAGLERVRAKVRRYRVAVLDAACSGRLVPTEAELARAEQRKYEHGEVLLRRLLQERQQAGVRQEASQLLGVPELATLPEGWEWATASHLCGFITKGTTPKAERLFRGSGDVPFIKVYNLTSRGALDFTVSPTFISYGTHRGELARSIVVPGDVLMNIVGPPLGKVAVVPSAFPQWNMNQAIAVFRPMPSYSTRFLALCLQSSKILNWAIRRAKATAGQFNLTLEICRTLPVPVPPLAEQERIVEEVERRLSVAEALEETIENALQRAERLRRSILNRAFEGRLVAQDPDDEPADVLRERIRAERAAMSTRGKAPRPRRAGRKKVRA